MVQTKAFRLDLNGTKSIPNQMDEVKTPKESQLHQIGPDS